MDGPAPLLTRTRPFDSRRQDPCRDDGTVNTTLSFQSESRARARKRARRLPSMRYHRSLLPNREQRPLLPAASRHLLLHWSLLLAAPELPDALETHLARALGPAVALRRPRVHSHAPGESNPTRAPTRETRMVITAALSAQSAEVDRAFFLLKLKVTKSPYKIGPFSTLSSTFLIIGGD